MKQVPVLFALFAVAFVVAGCTKPATPAPATPALNTNVGVNANVTVPVAPEAAAKVFNISAANFSYDVKEIRVKKGDIVKINVTNKEGMHDWVIDEFATRTKLLQPGETATVTIVPDRTGTFEYYCSVGQHRANGMFGKLIVE